ncbi:hypothetical protein COT12_00820 [Candidatus Berkelbacteria bacterium CG08_land_8_20_14_0_20_39_8]|uniref:DNA polymerase III subunit gamma/tau n=1 Tax=Candidatus Berkelbacteria bacterium CG08_land_8_20_14_0_20_39_8 TaxID=1974511 RepID=A0A2M6YCQ8_9BACT|nr:MAG: hypothetical protein COT12_00820 [Candidatus Berkelbacteria bacterium CG08_land_8_20_14_0_20_39_8]
MSLYRKYRPQKFADVVGEDHVRDTLLLAILENRVGHGYLFAGLRGSGKTTVARLLAKAVNCQNRDRQNTAGSGEPCGECQSCQEISLGKSLDIIEIDAASNRGIDEIRELRDKVKFAPANGKYKIFIIDEVHMLTTPAFNALLKTLEEPPAHAIFILATTEADKIPATILSRIQRFDFRRISKADIIKNLTSIAKSEKLKIDDLALEAIAVAGDGSHRDAISVLQQLASNSGEITLETVRNTLGLARSEEIIRLISLIAVGQKSQAIEKVSEFVAAGVEVSQIIKEIIEIFRQTLLCKISSGEAVLDQTKERILELNKLAEAFSAGELNRILTIFIEAGQQLKESPIRTLPIEMAIIEIAEGRFASEKLPDNRLQDQKNQTKNREPKMAKVENQVSIKPEDQKVVEEKAEISEIMESEGPKDEQGEKLENGEISGELWKMILEKIKEENQSLNALLRDAEPEGIVGEKITIGVRFKFHHDKILENKNRQILEKIFSDVLDKKCVIGCKIVDKKQKMIKKPSKTEDDLEKAAEEIFEAE